MTTREQLNDSFDSLAQSALRVKAERDQLLAALKDLIRQLPTDERLADYNLDFAESVLLKVEGVK
jgi:hypothetical protein